MDLERKGDVSKPKGNTNLPQPILLLILSKDLVAEAASAKIWAVYVAEAEKYDKALVESWKSNMEGMLIFVSLF